MVVLFGVADFLESNCTGKARDAINAVLALKPDTAILAATGAGYGPGAGFIGVQCQGLCFRV